MKRFVVIGLGNFGHIVAVQLFETGYDVVAIDPRPDVVDAIGPRVSRAVVGDGTKKSVLEEVGVRDADAAIVSTGENLSASLLSLLALRDLGIKRVFVKVRSSEHARIAEAMGAEQTIFPERESALGLASRLTGGALLQYVQLGEALSLQEMAVPKIWEGKTVRELSLPQSYRVQVVAVHDVLTDQMIPVPDPDRKLTASDTLLVAGAPDVLQRLAKLA